MKASTMIAPVVFTTIIIYSKSYSIKETTDFTEYEPKTNIIEIITTTDNEEIEIEIEEQSVDALGKCKI